MTDPGSASTAAPPAPPDSRARWWVYPALSVALLWPAALSPVAAVPGAARTDLADSLWTLWFTARQLAAGNLPSSVAGVLNHPDGGTFWPADPLNTLLAAPLTLTFGAAATWTLLAHLHLSFAGLAAHALAREWRSNGWVAGVLYAIAPITLAHVHNGASEALGGTGWLALAALAATRLARNPSRWRAAGAAAALAAAALSHVYTGALAFLFLAALIAAAGTLRAAGALVGAGAAGLLIALVPLLHALSLSTAPDNVVGIKSDKEVATIRRTIGAADPEGFWRPGDFRSPDFHQLSRYGEALVHCTYLGWVPLLAAACSLRRRRGAAALWLAGLAALALSMGPVLVQNGGPVILDGRRAVPLPYLLVERVPGFSSLSLLWRLAQLTALCLAVLAARAVGRSRLAGLVVVLASLAEVKLASPARSLPGHFDATVRPELRALAAEPPGAVMNFPVVGGRAYLYEQTVHEKPVTGSLNFPNNNTSREVWKVAMESAGEPSATFAERLVSAARAADVRYLVVHVDARAYDDDLHTDAVRAIKEAFTPIAASASIRVYRFW